DRVYLQTDGHKRHLPSPVSDCIGVPNCVAARVQISKDKTALRCPPPHKRRTTLYAERWWQLYRMLAGLQYVSTQPVSTQKRRRGTQ
ncbi:hypothetical protein J6590_028007, partial [Homalodisca vitripennis]